MLKPQQISNARSVQLIGKAAVSLITFHLSRRGYECVATTDNSSFGDLWIAMEDGVHAVEVKGSIADRWNIRSSQMGNVKFYGFVNIRNGACWLADKARVEAALVDRHKIQLFGMGKIEDLGALRLDLGFRTIAPFYDEKPAKFASGRRSARKVRKVMADGSIKEYIYPAYAETARAPYGGNGPVHNQEKSFPDQGS